MASERIWQVEIFDIAFPLDNVFPLTRWRGYAVYGTQHEAQLGCELLQSLGYKARVRKREARERLTPTDSRAGIA